MVNTKCWSIPESGDPPVGGIIVIYHGSFLKIGPACDTKIVVNATRKTKQEFNKYTELKHQTATSSPHSICIEKG